MNDRERAMRRVQICSFAVLEASLFLNSHPDDKEALEYINKYKRLNERAVAEFEDKYGTLSIETPSELTSWDWAENPWPWENTAI